MEGGNQRTKKVTNSLIKMEPTIYNAWNKLPLSPSRDQATYESFLQSTTPGTSWSKQPLSPFYNLSRLPLSQRNEESEDRRTFPLDPRIAMLECFFWKGFEAVDKKSINPPKKTSERSAGESRGRGKFYESANKSFKKSTKEFYLQICVGQLVVNYISRSDRNLSIAMAEDTEKSRRNHEARKHSRSQSNEVFKSKKLDQARKERKK